MWKCLAVFIALPEVFQGVQAHQRAGFRSSYAKMGPWDQLVSWDSQRCITCGPKHLTVKADFSKGLILGGGASDGRLRAASVSLRDQCSLMVCNNNAV